MRNLYVVAFGLLAACSPFAEGECTTMGTCTATPAPTPETPEQPPVVGPATPATPPSVRYPDGRLDPAFGSGGLMILSGEPCSSIAAMVGGPNGSVVVAGTAYPDGTTSRPAVARFLANGSRDPKFHPGGIVLQGTELNDARGLVLRADGSVLVAGDTATTSSFGVSLLDANGDLDNKFGIAGTAFADFDGRFGVTSATTRAVLTQPDGRIVLVGSALVASQHRFALARVTADGAIDPSFGDAGLTVTTPLGVTNREAVAASVQRDGKIIVAGHDPNAFVLARYNGDGQLDPTFGGGGTTMLSAISGAHSLSAIVVQPDDRIIAVGAATMSGGPSRIVVMRFIPNGAPDQTFGTNGIRTHALTSDDDVATSVALQDDGRILVGGYSGPGITNNSIPRSTFSVIRLTSTGGLDATFGNGSARAPLPALGPTADGGYSRALAMTLGADGALVVGGFAYGTSNQSSFALMQYR